MNRMNGLQRAEPEHNPPSGTATDSDRYLISPVCYRFDDRRGKMCRVQGRGPLRSTTGGKNRLQGVIDAGWAASKLAPVG